MRTALRLLVVAVLFPATDLGATSPAGAATRPFLSPPVDAPVIDPFREPAGPYGPGNRGLEYDTAVGQPVSAAAGGVVVFAGAVARTLHVTVDHGAGMISSYSFLDRILVAEGDVLRRHDRVGLAGETFHFGVRIVGRYVDPAALMGVAHRRVRLVDSKGESPLASVLARGGSGSADIAALVGRADPSTWYGAVTDWYRLLRG